MTTKVSIPPSPGEFNLSKILALSARFLAAFILLSSSFLVTCPAQVRTDNRRVFYTGANGAVWDNSTASWMTTGSFLAYAATDPKYVVWLTAIPETGEPVTADPAATFVAGDIVVFDGVSDSAGSTDTRIIEIASGGVTASDVIVNAASTTDQDGTVINNYIFTGGAIIADPASIAPDSLQVTGTGVGAAVNAVRPTGSLVKTGAGMLTLSNTAACHFAGGIHFLAGTLTITDNRALGDNSIITQYVTNAGGIEAAWGDYIGENLLKLIQRPGASDVFVPAVVMDSTGGLLATSNAYSDPLVLNITAEAAGIDITGEIYLGSRIVTLNIEGDTTISGRIVGLAGNYGSNGGTIIKEGAGTLTLTGTRNWFYGSGQNWNQINEGRVVITTPYALGTGATAVNPGAVLEFRGVVGTMRQAFIGGGDIEITQGSDLTFDWRNGTLDDYESMSGVSTWHPAMNQIGTITISGQSRFSAIASGTYSTVLGGAGAYVKVTEGSSLVLGREGLSARGSGSTEIPMYYPILASRIELTGNSTLVLNPNAYLSVGALLLLDDDADGSADSFITFGASGVSRIQWQEGTVPEELRYLTPEGMEIKINDIPVPSGYYREYVVINQGANPLKDIAMTLNALDALHDTVSARLADELTDPVANHRPSKKRKWVNEAWIRYIMSEIEYDATSITTPGMTGRINHVVAGFDGLLPGRIVLGIHAGMGDNTLDTTNNTTLSSKQKFIGLHAAQRFGIIHLAASGAIGRASTDSFRYEGDNSVRGKWDTSYYTVSVEAGATFSPWKKITLRPSAGLRYSNLKVGGYYERGLSPLIIDDFSDTGAQAVYGLVAGHKLTLFKRALALNLSLARKHTVKSPRGTLDTHYFDSPDTPVTLIRGDYYSTVSAIGLSARMATSRHTIVGLAADYETGASHNRLTGTFLIGYTW